MPVFNNILAGAAGSGGGADAYKIERSLRFNDDDSAYLSRTFSAGNRRTWTWSAWVKRGNFTEQVLFIAKGNGSPNPHNGIWIGGDRLSMVAYPYDFSLTVDRLLQDPSAWYHFVVAFDSTIASPASDRIKIWINGERQTEFHGTVTYPSQNWEGLINNNGYLSQIGQWDSSYNRFFDGYMADVHFIDGQALDETSFGKFDSTTGVWNPKEYSGTYGTNGFRLDFSDNSNDAALGTDSSGNNNTWTVHNLTAAGTTFTQTSVANATGGLPILNTTDTYGNSMGSGDRSDPLASNLQWCVPLGHNGSRDFYDKAITGRTSSVRHISGNPGSHNTSISNFYGGSLYMSGGASGSFSTDVWSSISAANSQFTFEFWIYLASTSQTNGYGSTVFSSRSTSNNGAGWFDIGFGGITGNKPRLRLQVSQGWDFKFNFDGSNNDAPFPSGEWIHIAITRDGSNNVRLFGNGILLQTQQSGVGITSNSLGLIGGHAYGSFASYVNYYLQDVRVYNTCKYTSSFNPPRETTSVLNAENIDSLLDSPTNYEADTGNNGGNYCTFNPLSNGAGTLSNGNLQLGGIGSPGTGRCNGTIAVSSGKWYYELKLSTPAHYTSAGIGQGDIVNQYPGQDILSYAYTCEQGTTIHNNSQPSYGSAVNSAGDILQVAFDLDNNKLFFGKNGTWMASSNPATGANPAFTITAGTYTPIVRPYDATGVVDVNFGARPFAYAIPTGFKSLCTENLPDAIVGTTVFDAKTYDGNGGSKVINSYKFSPDLAWFKRRDTTGRHTLVDTLRTRTKGSYVGLTTNASSPAEFTSDANKDVVSFDSNGFTLGPNNQTGVNENSAEMVAWAWDAGDAANATSVTTGSLNSSSYSYGTYSSKWNDTSSPGSTGTVNSGANAFNGDLSNYASLNSSNTFSKWKPSSPIQVNSSLRVLASGIGNGNNQVAVNGTYFYVTNKPKWYTISASYLIEIRLQDIGSTHGRLWAVEVDGKLLIDNSITPPSLPSIATSYRANDEAGFSIISYQGNGNTASVATGLSGEPGMILIKDRDTSTDWPVYHRGFDDPQANVNILNNLSTVQSISGYWTGTRSNLIGLKSGTWAHNTSGKNYIAYCWAQRDGFSKFSEYQGTGQSDGPFIHVGFRPRWILIKHTGGQDWVIFDTARDFNNNGNIEKITANETNGEVMHNNWIDIYSNGFKLRSSSAALNENGTKYIYSCFAEHPLKLARAR